MALDTPLSPAQIRVAKSDNPNMRERDLAVGLGISEAALLAADIGRGVTRIKSHPDAIMHAACTLGEVMALTRNLSCVSEVVGRYDNYQPGTHAAMILNEPIDLRIFPKHWAHAFAVEKEVGGGLRRSLQVFDAVHKIFLRDSSDHAAFARAVADLRHDDQSDRQEVAPAEPTEPARPNPEKRDALRDGWSRMTDTHQFFATARKLKMNRLGAYRIVGAPFVRPLAPAAVDLMLNAVQRAGIAIMIFVGNRGCIQIHSGTLGNLKQMGPWQNVLDPGFDMHLRLDHVAEVFAVDKPTKRGAAISVEAFDAEGGLILQIFPVPAGRVLPDSRAEWATIVAALPDLSTEVVA